VAAGHLERRADPADRNEAELPHRDSLEIQALSQLS
jgi:hypothetical protein